MRTANKILIALLVLLAPDLVSLRADEAAQRWTAEQANDWSRQTGWLVGCNFIPSTAINELEMWQAETFDPETINRELGWAQGLGFNCVRVFLHDLPWQQDSKGFLDRLDQFVALADKRHIKVMSALSSGGTLKFALGDKPSSWGENSAPPSFDSVFANGATKEISQ
jgi:hypothetical protein